MKILTRSYLIAAIPAAFWATAAFASSATDSPPTVDKSGYTLFNPTPREAMRKMSTDRPDKTESPYTVDAGHIQVEMDLATFTTDRSQGERTDTWNLAPVNFKVGLLNNADIQFIWESYLHERITGGSSGANGTTRSGVGDLTTRLKINLWGNDGGATAFGVMPFVKAPTNTANLGNHSVEGGLILPLAVSLPGGWNMGCMTEVDLLRNAESSGYHAGFVNSITFSHAVVGELDGYVEFFSEISSERGQDWVGTVDVGLTYALTSDLRLDCGVNLGVTRAADDFNPFTGLSWRF